MKNWPVGLEICNIVSTEIQHCKHRNSFQTSKFIPSIEINKVSFREQRLLGRHDNVKEIPQNLFQN